MKDLLTSPTRIVPFALTLAATACEAAPPNPPASQTQIEDSAGIHIVENARPETGSLLGWQVSHEPAISIGTVEGGEDFQLHQVGDALKLPDGRIVVANAGSHQLLVFDEAGNYLEAWGQRGEGPGDFSTVQGSDGVSTSVFWMERWPGDSLAVCSGSGQALNNVVSVWDTRGRHGRTLNLTRINRSSCHDVLAEGAILAARRVEGPSALPEKGMNRSQLEFSILAGDGSPLGALGRHPGGEIFWYFENHMGDGTGLGLYDPPFQKTLRWAAWGEFVVLAPTDRYELKAYRHDGSLARIVRRENDARSPTQADLESYLWVREYNTPVDGDRALLDGVRPRGPRAGIRRDAAGPGHPPDRRRLHPRQGAGQTGGGVCTALGTGQAFGPDGERGRGSAVLQEAGREGVRCGSERPIRGWFFTKRSVGYERHRSVGTHQGHRSHCQAMARA